MTVGYDMLFRDIVTLTILVFSLCIILLLGGTLIWSWRRERQWIATVVGQGFAAFLALFGSLSLYFVWLWQIQWHAVLGERARYDPTSLLYAGYVSLAGICVSSLWLIKVMSPKRWGHWGWIGALVIVGGTLAATHLPFTNRIHLGPRTIYPSSCTAPPKATRLRQDDAIDRVMATPILLEGDVD